MKMAWLVALNGRVWILTFLGNASAVDMRVIGWQLYLLRGVFLNPQNTKYTKKAVGKSAGCHFTKQRLMAQIVVFPHPAQDLLLCAGR